jgi:integrating conjugative element membrane protein (TIGR03745 family)
MRRLCREARSIFLSCGHASRTAFFAELDRGGQRSKGVALLQSSPVRACFAPLRMRLAVDPLAQPHGLKVGYVLSASWGYEQTNIDYYEVTALVGRRSVEVREIAQELKETGNMLGECRPTKGKFIGKPLVKRVFSCSDSRPCHAETTIFPPAFHAPAPWAALPMPDDPTRGAGSTMLEALQNYGFDIVILLALLVISSMFVGVCCHAYSRYSEIHFGRVT